MKNLFLLSILFLLLINGLTLSQINDKNYDRILADTLPPDMISRKIYINDNPSPGYVMIATSIVNRKNYLYMLDADAYPVKYKSIPIAYDFKLHSNGQYSYSELKGALTREDNAMQMIMDTNLNIIDTILCANGYDADVHDFIILPNGHYLIISYDPLPHDFSLERDDGNPGGTLVGAVLQELDKNKKPIFQWRSNDFLDYKDQIIKFSVKEVDYFHINSAKQDWDGNYIVSSRHMNQILKINRHTGDLIWKLGGIHNEFSFINENEANNPNYFSFQHDVQRLNNGNILLYDNGNHHTPAYSRAVEYKLDEVNKTAELIWEYRHKPDISGVAQGSVQRLINGNTLIDWGASNNTPKIDVTEVTPDKKVVWEMGLPKGTISYRAFKHPENPCKETARVKISEIAEGNGYTFKDDKQNTGISIIFKKITALSNNYCEATSYPCSPINPDFDEPAPIIYPLRWEIGENQLGDSQLEITIDIKNFDIYYPGDKLLVYARAKAGEGKFEPLNSIYDKNNRTITATSLVYGEFVIGMPDTIILPPAPALIYPADMAVVSSEGATKLKISPKGRANSYEVIISEDQEFLGEPAYTKVQDNAEFEFNAAVSGKTYYWRARTANIAGTSDWSEIRRFLAAEPFIKIITPNGGEYLNGDTIIRWSENIGDSVKIELIRDGETYKKIANSMLLPTGGMRWWINKDIPPDSVYRIKVSSTKNPEMFDLSDEVFSITLPTGAQEFSIPQNEARVYPNPTIGPINIDMKESLVRMNAFSVYNLLGEKLFEINFDESNSSHGIVRFDLSFLQAGVYLYRLSGDNIIQHGKLMLNK